MLVYMRISYISLVIFSRFSMKQYAVGQNRKNNYPATFHQSACTNPGGWLDMYIRLRCIGFVIFSTILSKFPLLTPPLLINVPVPSLSDSRTCMCVMFIDCFDDFYNRYCSCFQLFYNMRQDNDRIEKCTN